jgi:GxxExxY protein
MEVHRELEYGFMEAVYHEAMVFEFKPHQIPFSREALIPIHYKGGTIRTPHNAWFASPHGWIILLKASLSLFS